MNSNFKYLTQEDVDKLYETSVWNLAKETYKEGCECMFLSMRDQDVDQIYKVSMRDIPSPLKIKMDKEDFDKVVVVEEYIQFLCGVEDGDYEYQCYIIQDMDCEDLSVNTIVRRWKK